MILSQELDLDPRELDGFLMGLKRAAELARIGAGQMYPQTDVTPYQMGMTIAGSIEFYGKLLRKKYSEHT